MKALTFIGEISRKYPKLLFVNTVLAILLSLVETCALITVGPLIDFLTRPDLQGISPLTEKVVGAMSFLGLPITLGAYLYIFFGFIACSSGFRILAKYSILKIKYALMRDLMLGTFKDFFRARWHFFSSSKQGMLLNTFMREFNIVGDAFRAIPLFFTGIMQIVFCLAVPFLISWQVTLITLGAITLLVWPFFILGKVSYRLGKLNTSTGNQIGQVMQESLSLAKVILGFGNQSKNYDYLDDAFDAHRRVTIKSQTLGFAIPTLHQPLGAIALIVALFSARSFGVSLSETAVLLLALLRVVFSVGALASSKHALESFFPSYEQIVRLRNKAKDLRQPSGKKEFSGFSGRITIEDISFAYPGHGAVLSGVNMVIPKGKMIAIVGESGAGKSTLIDLIMGFHELSRGKIMLDGIGLEEFNIDSYRRRIGYVPQDSVLFNMSIRDNLLWAAEGASQEEIVRAAAQANADIFIREFKDGYDTVVGDRGIRLSGGQRQRIALARAILRKPALLFLDEATSSLDTRSERLIQQAIENIAKETTVVVIAHRLSTIVNADYVYVFNKGKIIEEGVYSQLVERGEHFNQMVKLQLLQASD